MNSTTDTPLSLTIVRVLPAPPARVYAAFTEVEMLRQWWGPTEVTTVGFDADLRVGGAWSWRLEHDDGEQMEAAGKYVEIVPGERLAFTWRWLDDEDWDDVESTVSVEFRPHAKGTEVHFTHVGFPTEKSRDNHTKGWGSNMDELVAYLGA